MKGGGGSQKQVVQAPSFCGVGDVIKGQYRLDKVLYCGSKSVIFAAEDEDRDEDVAVKLVFNSEACAKEINNLKLMRKVDRACEHVVRILSSDMELNVFMLERGQTYSEWKGRVGLKLLPVMMSIGPDMLNALEFLHTSVGFAHCDIKLPNVMWFEVSKKFKLVDLGAATKVGEDVTEYTLSHLPPEAASDLLAGRKIQASVALDMWMVGVTLMNLGTESFWEDFMKTKPDQDKDQQILHRLVQPKFIDSIDLKHIPRHLRRILLSDLFCAKQRRASTTQFLSHAFWTGEESTSGAHEMVMGSAAQARPWDWSVRAKEAEFHDVKGFRHKQRQIYVRDKLSGDEWMDDAFETELEQLLTKFNRSSEGQVQVLEVHAIDNRSRAQSHEAHLQDWQVQCIIIRAKHDFMRERLP